MSKPHPGQSPAPQQTKLDRAKIEADQRDKANLIQLQTRRRNLIGDGSKVAKTELARVDAMIAAIKAHQ